METWLGVDVGTSSVKAVAVQSDGRVVGRASHAHRSSFDGRRHEQRSSDHRAGLDAVIRDLAHLPLAGIGIVGQTPTVVAVDGQGHPIEPAITWRDTRATAESEELQRRLAPPEDVVGVRAAYSVGQLPAQLLWMSRHRGDALERARWVGQPKDALGGALTGAWGSDPWSLKGLVHVGTGEPVGDVLDLVGIGHDLIPSRQSAWDRRGTVGHAAAQRHGLVEGTPVAVGWTDALGAMLAIGAPVRPTRFMLTGTSDIVGASSTRAATGAEGLFTVPTNCSPLAIHYGPTQSSGASLTWLSRLTGRTPEDLCDRARPSSDGRALFVPFLRGERAPLWSTGLRGATSGLADTAGPAEFADAVLMGVACSGASVLEAAAPHTDADPTVHLAGAAVDHPAWIDSRLRALGTPIALHHESNAAALGAAMLARAASGDTDIVSAQADMQSNVVVHEPTQRHLEECHEWRRLYALDVAAAVLRAQVDTSTT